ncbi:MAG: hypothetical protein AB7H92_16145 [Microbacteriaceae bacterium]
MPIVKFYTVDPGGDVLTANTQINIIGTLTAARRYAAGRGTLLLVGAVVNDGGIVNVPTLLTGGISSLKKTYGGFRGWLGDENTLGTAGDNFDDRGKLSGYNGNLYALTKGLDAPAVVLCVPDLAVKTATIASGTDLLVSLTRSSASNGAITVPAGTRIKASGGYMVATLQDVSWGAAETGSKTVRFRQVSPSSTNPVDISTITTFVGEAAGGTATTYAGDTNITVNTSATTVPDAIDAAELILRYTAAFGAVTQHAAGVAVDVVACDRDEAAITDLLAAHCESASLQGMFRRGVVSPPLGTTAAVAQGSSGVGVGRSTLKRAYVAYTHPGIRVQFFDDADNLTAPDYTVAMGGACTLAARWANSKPEANPANPHPVLENRKIVGVESLATMPDRATHETAGIVQPVIEYAPGGFALTPTYHAGIMANGTTKMATARMQDFLHRNLLAIAVNYHKQLATQSNKQGFIDGVDGFLDRLVDEERLESHTDAVGTWDNPEFTVDVTATEVGNMDVITLRTVFGPASVTVSATV